MQIIVHRMLWIVVAALTATFGGGISDHPEIDENWERVSAVPTYNVRTYRMARKKLSDL